MKIRRYDILLFLILAASFLWGLPSTTHAYFSDSTSVDAGIKITLGSINLEVNNVANAEGFTLGNEINEVQLKDTVHNTGTLTGKLAYKINLKNSKGEALDYSLLSSLKITLNNQELNLDKLDQYMPVLTQDGESFYLDPKETSKEVSIRIRLASEIQREELITIEMGYMLLQTNGTIAEPLFHDIANSTHKVKIAQTNDFWPNKKIYSVGNYKYAIDMPETFYFSDREKWEFLSNSYYHTSINDGIFYLESTGKVTNWENVVRMQNTESFSYKIEPISEYRAKVHFYFDKDIKKNEEETSFYSDYTKFELSDNGKTWNKILQQSYTAGKILLSSDTLNLKTGKIAENKIDLAKSIGENVSVQHVSKSGSNYKKEDVNFDTSIILNANLYINFFWAQDIEESVEVIGNSKIPLLNSLNADEKWWTKILKLIADISDNYTPQLQINLNNSKTNQTLVLHRNMTNILQLQNNNRNQKTTLRRSQSLELKDSDIVKYEPLSIEETRLNNPKNKVEDQPKADEKVSNKQPVKEFPKNNEEYKLNQPINENKNSDIEKPRPDEEKEVVPKEPTEEVPEIIEEDNEHLPVNEEFIYLEVKIKDYLYEVGITQEQLDWVMTFKTIEEFVSEANSETSPLLIKYDRIKGIENIEIFIDQLAKLKRLDLTLEVKNYPEQKVVEIKVIK